MVTVTPSHYLPLNPRKLRLLALLFVLAAVCALATGCSASSSGSMASLTSGDPYSGLRGLALASRPADHVESDPAQPQRHARPSQFAPTQFSTVQHRGLGGAF